jgi:2-deoxy-D-gluconate 3-dehydrogenase
MNQLFNLSGKKALVTGCSRGIGQAMAVGLAEAGADIIGVSSSLQPGGKTEKDVLEQGQKFYPYSCDFSDRHSLYAFINQVKQEHPQIDFLINNAGIILRKPAAEHPDEYWDKVIDINLNAQFILTREIGKEMVDRRQGKIIFTCSLLTFQGGITVPGYAASKAALGSLIKAFANEWAGKGVNVNGIARGIFLQTIQRPCGQMQNEANQYLIEYRQEDGESPKILKDLLFSFALKPQNMFTELS